MKFQPAIEAISNITAACAVDLILPLVWLKDAAICGVGGLARKCLTPGYFYLFNPEWRPIAG